LNALIGAAFFGRRRLFFFAFNRSLIDSVGTLLKAQYIGVEQAIIHN
jgi:hypothetical protein